MCVQRVTDREVVVVVDERDERGGRRAARRGLVTLGSATRIRDDDV